MNMYELIELPFTNEIAIEAMLFENLAMLQLGKTLVKPRIIRHEVALLDASGREERINLLIQTEQFSVNRSRRSDGGEFERAETMPRSERRDL